MKNKINIIRIVTMALLCAVLLAASVGCNKSGGDGTVTKLSFKAASGYDYLKTLDGQQVSINGYMATSSPVDGSFMFLMNMPYQSCPFCIPNTTELSNTMEIYPKSGDSFAYTAQAIKVVGKLVVAASKDKPFTDKYGYQFNFKIVDAEYTIMKAEEMSSDMALWQKIAESDVVNDIYKMYDYVNFLCAWNTYTVNSYTNADGETVPGYYLYPSDAEKYLYNDGAQFNYGYKDGYFDAIVKKIESVDKEAFGDLVANVRKAEALAKKALAELENKQYTYEYKYVEQFGQSDYVYTLNIGDQLRAEMDVAYMEFSNWLGSWEM